MEIKDTLKCLKFDVQQIDHTIDLLNYLTHLDDTFSTSGKSLLETNIKNLWQVQKDLQQLQRDFENQLAKRL